MLSVTPAPKGGIQSTPVYGQIPHLNPRIQAGITLYLGLPINNLWKSPPLSHILVTPIPPDTVTHRPAPGSNLRIAQCLRERKACAKAWGQDERRRTRLQTYKTEMPCSGHSTRPAEADRV